jgi:hypothetical protein
MNIKKYVVLTATIAFSAASHAGPITIAGLNWEMSPEEMQAELEQRGYACEPSEMIKGRVDCAQGDKDIKIDAPEKEVSFTCEVFNGCGYEVKEVAQSAVNNGLINELTPYTDSFSGRPGYKGRNDDGDVLLVYQNANFGGEVWTEMEIQKGTLGSGEMQF